MSSISSGNFSQIAGSYADTAAVILSQRQPSPMRQAARRKSVVRLLAIPS